MFSQLVTVVGIILVAIFILDHFLLGRFMKRRSILWDIAPVIGFAGAILVSLAFVEAVRRGVIEAFRWGSGFGVVLLLGLALLVWLQTNAPSGGGASGLRTAARIAQTFGIVLLFGILGVVIAVRIIGALLEVFIASALGVLAVGAVLGFFVREWRRKAINSKE